MLTSHSLLFSINICFESSYNEVDLIQWSVPQDEKSHLQNICNPVPKCKCRECNKFAIVQIHVQMYMYQAMSVKNIYWLMRRYFTMLVTMLPSNHSWANLHNSKFVAPAACSANFILYTLFRQQMYTKACFADKYADKSYMLDRTNNIGSLTNYKRK